MNDNLTIRTRPHQSFTLVEMLVVIAIIGVLAALMMPALQNAMESSRAISCAGSLRGIGMGVAVYTDENNRIIPSCWYWYLEEVPDSLKSTYGAVYGMGHYIDEPIFTACPSRQVIGTTAYGMNEVVGTSAFGKYIAPDPPAAAPEYRVKLSYFRRPAETITLVDGYEKTGVDTRMARPKGEVGTTYERWGYKRHGERPNMVHGDGHVSRKVYIELTKEFSPDTYKKFWYYK